MFFDSTPLKKASHTCKTSQVFSMMIGFLAVISILYFQTLTLCDEKFYYMIQLWNLLHFVIFFHLCKIL